jgi:protein PhnA
MKLEQDLINRGNSCCELCGSNEDLSVFEVTPFDDTTNTAILVCKICKEQLQDHSKIDPSHWHCLNDSMWSEIDAVKVVAYRMLHALNNQDLLDMIYLEDDIKEWADSGLPQTKDEDAVIHRDCNGVILTAGDTVTIVKDLPVKGAGFTAKQGTAVRNISLPHTDPEHIEGRVNGVKIMILTKYLKKQ